LSVLQSVQYHGTYIIYYVISKAPEPVDSWDGILDATKHSNPCVQNHETNSSEDCLYLNVYTPSTDGNFPVMFWIHGGAFYLGHRRPDMYGPDYFMDSNVVLVSANFRLGVLGELCIIV